MKPLSLSSQIGIGLLDLLIIATFTPTTSSGGASIQTASIGVLVLGFTSLIGLTLSLLVYQKRLSGVQIMRRMWIRNLLPVWLLPVGYLVIAGIWHLLFNIPNHEFRVIEDFYSAITGC
jgi:hypothetical protein